MARSSDGALVLFSGGQDSATCLAWALSRFERVETVGFDYGQRHRVELEVRGAFREALTTAFPAWGKRLGDDHLLNASMVNALGATAMTADIAIAMAENGLPNTFVPGRNLLFFTLAGALAYRRGLRVIIGGMCETDYSGYPDCRDDTLKALQVALSLGLDRRITIETPLMWLDKAETFALAQELGGNPLLDLVIESTHTCYLGDRANRHSWGYGCGTCPACALRAGGWAKFKAEAA
ncbi:preQ(0) biosynthesis protein QueC [Phyllobacterium sp. YR620]|uniref:7-cyano-7-deazaguanine synthase QueC n=1 Tax=unclassified Phyllobacterium TaxID=2638441 RepID=UPI00088B27E2|nr:MULTISPECIES: 7-cyano-7-deazaguanine synthase QueC [unclassified Phyllobacterium]SDP38943.1 preQ(0) biosynthesis protein QueC [Phyllobacterium sp. YR620]SFI75669.1 preQ(0) biosynthesis protein QueC [Phyllobacterium sp. CL33Tsu]